MFKQVILSTVILVGATQTSYAKCDFLDAKRADFEPLVNAEYALTDQQKEDFKALVGSMINKDMEQYIEWSDAEIQKKRDLYENDLRRLTGVIIQAKSGFGPHIRAAETSTTGSGFLCNMTEKKITDQINLITVNINLRNKLLSGETIDEENKNQAEMVKRLRGQ